MNKLIKIQPTDKITEEQKSFLISMFSNIFNACFASRIEECDTFEQLKRLIFQNAEGIGDYLELTSEDEIDELEEEVTRLEGEVEDLEYRLKKYESGSLLDVWKGEILEKYMPLFTPMELEERLRT